MPASVRPELTQIETDWPDLPAQPGQRIDSKARDLIEKLAMEGHDVGYIEAEVRKNIPPAQAPSRKTIGRMVHKLASLDRSGPWSLAQASDDEAELILPVLRAYHNLTSLRFPAKSERDFYITAAEARWIVRVQRAAPDLNSIDVYRLVRAYIARETRGEPTYDLDAMLAWRPWDETEIEGTGYFEGRTTTNREQYAKGVRERWIPPAPAFFMRELAGIEWNPTQSEWAVYVGTTYAHDPDSYQEAGAFGKEQEAIEWQSEQQTKAPSGTAMTAAGKRASGTPTSKADGAVARSSRPVKPKRSSG